MDHYKVINSFLVLLLVFHFFGLMNALYSQYHCWDGEYGVGGWNPSGGHFCRLNGRTYMIEPGPIGLLIGALAPHDNKKELTPSTTTDKGGNQ